MTDAREVAGPSCLPPALALGFLAYVIARACDVPIWRNMPAGDATDIAAATVFATYFLLRWVRNILAEEDGR